ISVSRSRPGMNRVGKPVQSIGCTSSGGPAGKLTEWVGDPPVQRLPHSYPPAKPLRHGKADGAQIEPRVGDLLRCVVATVAAKHHERLDLQREASRHDPANTADHDVRVTHQREQLTHHKLTKDKVVVRWRKI